MRFMFRCGLCVVLLFSTLMGVPMRPKEIEELMRLCTQPKIVQEYSKDKKRKS